MTNWNGLSPDDKNRFSRATELDWDQGSGEGAVLLQKYIDRVVQFLTLREMGLLAVMDRKEGSGPAAYVNQRTSGAGGGWYQDDGGEPSGVSELSVGTFAQKDFPYKTLITRGQVSRKLQAIGQSYIDILAMEMAGKAEDFASSLENGLIYGTFGVGAGNEPMGLLTLLENANLAGSVTPTAESDGEHIKNNCAGQTDTNKWRANYPLSLANLDATIDAVKGSANRSDLVIVGSFAAIRQVNAALQAQQQFVNEVEIAAGFRVRTYDGIPLVVSSEMKDNMVFQGGTKGLYSGHVASLNGGAGTALGTQLFVINRRHVFISELTPTTVMPLAKDTSVVDKFDMYWDGAPVLANPYGMGILSNISSDGTIVDTPV